MIRYLFICCICLSSPFAQSGSVSFELLKLLHPKMTSYHFGIHRFFKEELNESEKVKACKNINLKWSGLRKDYETKMQTIRDQMQQAKEKLLAQKQRDTWNQIHTMKSSMIAKMKQRTKSHIKECDSLLSSVFLSREQSQKILESIQIELHDTAESLTRIHNLSYVFENGAESEIPATLPELSPLANPYPNFMNPEFIFADFLDYKDSSLKLTKLHPNVISERPNAFLPSIDHLPLYLSRHCNVPKYPSVMGDLMDLNTDILYRIYEKYKYPIYYPQTLSNIVKEFIQP